MPTAYVGDKTQTQPPSVKPQSGGPVTVNLPADGDPPSASTWSQAYKALADWIDFLLKPAAKASDWLGEIVAWRAAIGHRRFAIDHLGFPVGRVLSYDAVWQTGTLVGALEERFPSMPAWNYKAVQTTGSGYAIMAYNAYGPTLRTVPGQSVGDYVRLYAGSYGTLRADNHVVLEFDSYGYDTSSRHLYIGLSDVLPSHFGDAANFVGFRIILFNWECVTRFGGAETATLVDAASPPSGLRPKRLRVEWHGESVADNGVRAVRFYIDGALVATHTTNLPVGMPIYLGISDYRAAPDGGGGSESTQILPLRLRMSTFNADTVL